MALVKRKYEMAVGEASGLGALNERAGRVKLLRNSHAMGKGYTCCRMRRICSAGSVLTGRLGASRELSCGVGERMLSLVAGDCGP